MSRTLTKLKENATKFKNLQEEQWGDQASKARDYLSGNTGIVIDTASIKDNSEHLKTVAHFKLNKDYDLIKGAVDESMFNLNNGYYLYTDLDDGRNAYFLFKSKTEYMDYLKYSKGRVMYGYYYNRMGWSYGINPEQFQQDFYYEVLVDIDLKIRYQGSLETHYKWVTNMGMCAPDSTELINLLWGNKYFDQVEREAKSKHRLKFDTTEYCVIMDGIKFIPESE